MRAGPPTTTADKSAAEEGLQLPVLPRVQTGCTFSNLEQLGRVFVSDVTETKPGTWTLGRGRS